MRAQTHPLGVKADLPRDAQGRLILDIYARMSDGFEGKEINVASQFSTCDMAVAARGAVVGERFSDPLSAWKRNVRRPEWERLVERMRTGQTAGAVIYHVDRFLRQPRELERLLDTVEQMGCVLISGGSERKLDSPEDRFILRIEVAQACKASDDTQRRVKAKFAALRDAGVLVESGPRPFAWPGMLPPKPGQKKRKEAPEELVAREVEALKAAFIAVARDTMNLTQIANAWNEAGLRTYYGNLWTNITVRQVMTLGRHAGRIEHEKEAVGMVADHEPTIDPALFDQVQMKFASRRRGRPASKVFLGSGYLTCSDCLLPMSARPRYPGGDSSKPAIPTYYCRKRPNNGGGCHRQIDQEPVDVILRQVVIARLSDPAVAGRISEYAIEADVRAVGIEAELTSARETESSMTMKWATGDLPNEVYAKAHPVVSGRIKALEAQLAQLTAAAADLGAVKAQSELSVARE